MYFSPKVNASLKNEIVNILNIQQKSTIGKYLGVHYVLFWKDHVNAKGWKKGTLSRACRLTLIKSNLSSMPNHVMCCFKCPKKLTNKIDKITRDFFWGSDRKCPTVAWEQVCQPKAVGGLVLDLLDFSTMQLWRNLLGMSSLMTITGGLKL